MSSKTSADKPVQTGTLKPIPHKGCSPIVAINGVGAVSVPDLTVSVPYQFSLPLNWVEFDFGYCLATNPESFSHDWVISECGVLIEEILTGFHEYRTFHGGKRFHEKRYRGALNALLANLLGAYRKNAHLLIPRRTSHHADRQNNPGRFSARILNALCEYITKELQLITFHVGPNNEHQHMASWAVAMPELIARYEQAKILLHPERRHIEIRDDKKRFMRLPKNRNKVAEINRLERPAKLHNQTWTKHQATLRGVYVLPWLTRKFNLTIDYGGRFYGNYQNLPKEDRQLIRIDGQITVEHDYKAFDMNLLYTLEGLQFVGDPYRIQGYDRGTAKNATLRLLNFKEENLPAFKASVTRSGDINVQRDFAEYSINRTNYDTLRAIGLKAEEPYKPKSLKGFIPGIKPGTRGEQLFIAIMDKHKAISHHFCTDRIGLLLQKQGSDVMALALTQLARVPVLPVHDSIRCRRDDSKKVLDAMHSAYREVTGFGITVETKAL